LLLAAIPVMSATDAFPNELTANKKQAGEDMCSDPPRHLERQEATALSVGFGQGRYRMLSVGTGLGVPGGACDLNGGNR
jgi:hypothetical protein